MGYEGPQVRHHIDVNEEDNDKGHVYTNAVDISSLGCVLYQIRARQLLFPTSRQLKRFCDGKAPFPTQPLIENTSGSGIIFLKDLLVSTPSLRPTVDETLQAAWLRSKDLSDTIDQSRHDLLELRVESGGFVELPLEQLIRPLLDPNPQPQVAK